MPSEAQRISTYYNWRIRCVKGIFKQAVIYLRGSGFHNEANKVAEFELALLDQLKRERDSKIAKLKNRGLK